MKPRDRVVRGLLNAVIDALLLILSLLLYYFFSLYVTRYGVVLPITYGRGELIILIIALILISFLRGALSGHVFSIPLIIAEAFIITYVFASIPSVIQYGGVIINIRPISIFLLGVLLSWYIYSLVSELHNSLVTDP
ncbi:hypothetical protein [Vulcanisaeta thermophila]|uniref:hypothetical protein n=1 Tax=Vulcanisaeta thermophila TaxID=867917 RepID=UPI000853DFC7|nr:hypothetical protein [Vulcanisaeta thermophila]